LTNEGIAILVKYQMMESTQSKTEENVMPKAETRVLTAHVPVPLAEKVDQVANRLERSRGWIMKQALSSWIAQEEERDRLTYEALAEVDTDRAIDHQAVQAWADSLSTDEPLPVPR
jgi:predicted transcriptional regulator